MMGSEEFSLKVELRSNPRILSVVRATVEELSAVAGFPEDERHRITLALDEALTNIIRHAYGNQYDQPIELTCRLLDDRLEFLLQDRGRPVDKNALQARPLGEERMGGLGSHLIAHIMDEVKYERLSDQNQLRLVKYRPVRPAERDQGQPRAGE